VVYGGIFGGIGDLSHRRSLSVLRITLAAALMLNLAAVFAIPELGTHGATLWRGFMAHKNIAGMLCAFTVIVFAFDGRQVPLGVRIPVIAGSLIFLACSWSKTALIALPIALAAGALVSRAHDRASPQIPDGPRGFATASHALLAIVAVGLILLTLQRDLLLSLTEDTSILTTRGAIWRPMIQFYLDSPLLGAGYGAYWEASQNLVDSRAIKSIWKDVDHGHNGYLDLLVQVGLPGLLLALYAALAWPLSQFATITRRQPQRAALIVATLVFSLIENFSESSLLADDTLGNAILLIALAQIHRVCRRSSPRASTKLSTGRTGL